MTHYKAFIEVAKGLGATQEDLQHADSQLDALLADLPTLSAACEHFAKSTAAFTARRAESKQLLSARPLAWHPVLYHISSTSSIREQCTPLYSNRHQGRFMKAVPQNKGLGCQDSISLLALRNELRSGKLHL